MRTTTLGIVLPLLLLAATFAAVVPQASAQASVYEVSGRVVSDAGDPLGGARVTGYTYPEQEGGMSRASGGHSDAITDADGRYTLKLPAGKGYVNVYYEEWRLGDGREITVEGNLSDVVFTLKTPPPKTAIVSGIVLGADGKPVEGATVQLQYGCCYAMPADSVEERPKSEEPAIEPADARMSKPMIMPPYHDDYQTATTGADGAFSFKAYPGPRQVTAWAKGYAQTTVQVTAVENETTEVKVQLEKIPPRDAILQGRVVDRETGAPIEGAHVNVRSLEWGRWAEAITGKDGSYRLTTVPGWIEVSVSVWNNEPIWIEDGAATDLAGISARPIMGNQYYAYTDVLKIASGENTHEVKLDAKEKPSLVLLGYVVDPDSQKGVPGAQVNIWNQQTGDWGQATTDKTGSFKILVSPGHYSGSAWKEGHLGGTQTFLVTTDKAQRVDLVLPKGTYKYAPCDEGDCGGHVLYAKDASVGSVAPAPMAGGGASPAVTRSAAMPENGANGDAGNTDNARAATYAGEGGGLPEYDPANTGSVPAAQATQTSAVPGLGMIALLGAAAVVALLARRR